MNINKVCILRSASGGGKSTLAKKISATHPNNIICSADDYWYHGLEQIPENYKFDFNNLYIAHKNCQQKFTESLEKNIPLIIIDNTNIKSRDYKFYFLTGIEYGYEVEFHTIIGGTVDQHFKSNIHNVPYNVIEQMVKNLQPVPLIIKDVTTKELFYNFNELRQNKENKC